MPKNVNFLSQLTKEEIWWPLELWGENPDRGPTEKLPVLGGGNISGLNR